MDNGQGLGHAPKILKMFILVVKIEGKTLIGTIMSND
jgi:hypothetical protein